MKLIIGNGYIWIFCIFAVVFIFIGVIGAALKFTNPKYAIVLFPILFGFILISEIRSGVALDSWWRAKFGKGTWQYAGLIALHSFAFVMVTAICILILFGKIN